MATQTLPKALRRPWALLQPQLLWGVAALLLAIVLGSVVATSLRAPATATPVAAVTRATLTSTVTASGTVNPQNTVAVGSQVSGTISQIDVDFNSKVHKGEVLARLDPSTLQAQVDQTSAGVAQAQAQAVASGSEAMASQAAIVAAQANLAKTQSALLLARQTQARDAALLRQGYLPASQGDADASAMGAALGDVGAATATVAQARATAQGAAASAQAAGAQIASTQAALAQNQLNLDRSTILSPVDGTVISRAVSVGQTVAASLQTPTLFEIAQDLTKMELDINVGEPDIGAVRAGDPIAFTVLAYPNRTFAGVASEVRLDPSTVNNVVTYTAIVLVNNADGALLPGMTANASIVTATAKNALVVPLPALHQGSTSGTAAGASPWGSTASAGAGAGVSAGGLAELMVRRNGAFVPMRVRVDLVNATQAAVTPISGTLTPGDQVAIGSVTHAARSSAQRPPMGGLGRGFHP